MGKHEWVCEQKRILSIGYITWQNYTVCPGKLYYVLRYKVKMDEYNTGQKNAEGKCSPYFILL